MVHAASPEVRCNCTSSLLDSGGAPVFDSGEGRDYVDGEVCYHDQRGEGKVVVCSNGEGKVGLNRLRVRGGGHG